jgi:putative hydrolase
VTAEPPARAETVDPLDALERISYLLERSGAPTYRVRAFRGAAATLRGVGEERVRRMAREGRLQELPGVGATTGEVVSQAVAGEVPGYLAKLESELATEDVEASAVALEIRAALRGDCHSHSDWSDGGSTIEEMAVAARGLGHEYLALTDHSPRLTVARGLSAERLREQLELVAELNGRLAPFRILTGIEVDILDDGSLDQEPELLARLDVVVASVHSKLRMDAAAMTRRMLAAVDNPHADILGHCTGRLRSQATGRSPGRGTSKGRPESTFDAEAVFAACARTDTAVEINSRPERLDPPRRLLKMVVEAGCKVAIDTDAHAPGQLEWQSNGCARAADCEVPLETIVNTWSAAELCEWTAGHGG